MMESRFGTTKMEPRFGSTKDARLAPILRRYKHKMRISELPDEFQIALPATVSTDDGKLAFVKNSKAGCTSVAHLLYQYTHNKPFTGHIHRDNRTICQGVNFWRENMLLLESGSSTKFAIVRDPEARCISGFKDFFVFRNNRIAKKHFKAISAFGYDPENALTKNFDIFLDYIEASQELDPYRVDRHWRAQHINLGIGKINYNHVGKIETLHADMKIVFDMVNTDSGALLSQLASRRNKTKDTDLILSESQSRRIKRLYASDYEQFGY